MQTKVKKQIFLIRHAKPVVNRKGLFSAQAAQGFLSAYDAASVEVFVLQHEAIPYEKINRVYCSTLIRSQLTAKAIFGEQAKLVIDSRFREFEQRIYSLPFIKLPIKFWLVSARILWFLGLNHRAVETFRQARQRAQEGAALLAQGAEEDGVAVLVAHGLLNRFILRALERMGWQATLKGGHGYVGVSLLEKEQKPIS